MEASEHTRLPKLIGALLLILAVFVAALVLPSHKPEPHDVPVGMVGPAQLEHKLEQARPGSIDVKSYGSEGAAREAIMHREIYGALVVEANGSRLLIASAASATVAQALRTGVEHVQSNVEVEDIKPLVSEDPRGSTLNSLFLALIMVASISVVLLGSLGLTVSKLIAGLVAFAVLGGLTVVALVAEGIGALPGSFVALSGVMALTLLAIALPTAGLQRLFGQAGVALGGLTFVLLANPASGNATAPEMLPGFWRAISQFMPPGAGGMTLRNTAYFDGNATLQPLLVLSAYAAGGALLVLVTETLRRRRSKHSVEVVQDDQDVRKAA
jgi:hypothetical protein